MPIGWRIPDSPVAESRRLVVWNRSEVDHRVGRHPGGLRTRQDRALRAAGGRQACAGGRAQQGQGGVAAHSTMGRSGHLGDPVPAHGPGGGRASIVVRPLGRDCRARRLATAPLVSFLDTLFHRE
jgi:hypothetical protein